MSVFLESIDITGLVMEDTFPSGMTTIAETSSAGSLILFQKSISYFEINLIGGADYGWLSLSILDSLNLLSQSISAIYSLDYEGSLYTVRFRTEDPPVISGDKVVNRSNQEGSDFYNNIIIKLMGI